MLDLKMLSNVDDIIASLNELEFHQVPFALAHALTVTAHEGRKEVVAELPDRFHIRTPWTAKGVRATAANRRDRDPSAAVSTKDWYMADQEAGGERKPKSGHIWVPTLEARAGGAITGRVLARNYPKNIRKAMEKPGRKKRKVPGRGTYAKPKAFIVGNNVYIRQDDHRLPIVRLYALTDHATLPPRWGFEKTMQRVSGKQLRLQFIRALDGALKTAKGGPVKSAYVDHLMEHDGTGGADIFGSAPTFAQTLAQNG